MLSLSSFFLTSKVQIVVLNIVWESISRKNRLRAFTFCSHNKSVFKQHLHWRQMCTENDQRNLCTEQCYFSSSPVVSGIRASAGWEMADIPGDLPFSKHLSVHLGGHFTDPRPASDIIPPVLKYHHCYRNNTIKLISYQHQQPLPTLKGSAVTFSDCTTPFKTVTMRKTKCHWWRK